MEATWRRWSCSSAQVLTWRLCLDGTARRHSTSPRGRHVQRWSSACSMPARIWGTATSEVSQRCASPPTPSPYARCWTRHCCRTPLMPLRWLAARCLGTLPVAAEGPVGLRLTVKVQEAVGTDTRCLLLLPPSRLQLLLQWRRRLRGMQRRLRPPRRQEARLLLAMLMHRRPPPRLHLLLQGMGVTLCRHRRRLPVVTHGRS